MANRTLKKLKYDNSEVQVESAIRDGDGNVIDSTYANLESSNTFTEPQTIAYTHSSGVAGLHVKSQSAASYSFIRIGTGDTSQNTYAEYAYDNRSGAKNPYVYFKVGNSTGYSVAFPKKTGTIALTSDLKNVAYKNADNNFSTDQTVLTPTSGSSGWNVKYNGVLKCALYSSSEGGNLRLISPDDSLKFEIDCYDNRIRFLTFDTNGSHTGTPIYISRTYVQPSSGAPYYSHTTTMSGGIPLAVDDVGLNALPWIEFRHSGTTTGYIGVNTNTPVFYDGSAVHNFAMQNVDNAFSVLQTIDAGADNNTPLNLNSQAYNNCCVGFQHNGTLLAQLVCNSVGDFGNYIPNVGNKWFAYRPTYFVKHIFTDINSSSVKGFIRYERLGYKFGKLTIGWGNPGGTDNYTLTTLSWINSKISSAGWGITIATPISEDLYGECVMEGMSANGMGFGPLGRIIKKTGEIHFGRYFNVQGQYGQWNIATYQRGYVAFIVQEL